MFTLLPNATIMKLINKLNKFSAINIADCAKIDFSDSTESKFILSAKKLKKVLEEIKGDYYILQIKDKRIFKYTNEYYDTEDYKMYLAYHNGNGTRYLIKNNEVEGVKNRSIEIKCQSNKGEVSKVKRKAKGNDIDNSVYIKQFVQEHTPYNPSILKKTLKNKFYRIVLVHKKNKEKISIDLNLKISNTKNKKKLPHLAIVEVKQERFSLYSDFVLSLRKYNVQRTSLSKYCIGVALLNKDVKKNKYKSKLLAISKINDNEISTQQNITA
jgi:hypothetical protein